MEKVKRTELQFDDYLWQESGEESAICGIPRPGPYDNRAGEEVLALINCFVKRYGLTRPEPIRKIELLLHDHLPNDISCRREAFIWIRDHWSSHHRPAVKAGRQERQKEREDVIIRFPVQNQRTGEQICECEVEKGPADQEAG